MRHDLVQWAMPLTWGTRARTTVRSGKQRGDDQNPPCSWSKNINTLRPRQNGRHFADDILKCVFFSTNLWILIKISVKFVPRGPIHNTVGTPYNTAPYITGSNIAGLGHGSQNSWSKLWIPIVKSVPVRVIFTWKSVPKKSTNGSSDIYLGTQWKQRHDSPWSCRSDVIVTFLWYGTIGIIWHRDHQSTAKKV